MKYFILLVSISTTMLLSACSKSNDGTPPVAPSPTNDTFNIANATLLKQGSFSGSSGYSVSGTVRLYDYQGKKYIYFENFMSSNGPDLKVYVATNNSAGQFINLGVLKGTSGAQTYLVNNPPDFNQYNRVLIWCQRFNVLFGSAPIQ